ncbi:tyrosine recombinase XerC [Mesorhizobium sp. ESP-6-2]|uniref:site-specific integrase n=1 Tax=Mesorhizobium sp. ESP-6-2 TaxID=2876625 RepID=UPI001CCCABB6|nr:hypothetical protein [Mesorhizobium sp. ESP-6-2]MBZ9807637.1 hypothetical protein [Mesorhizobium sp. ESP-6-2]
MARSGKSGMVELPRHVHRITKRRKDGKETVYTFYTRNRNTPAALPSIALPEPLSKEFPQAVEICALLERANDRWFLMGAELPDHRDRAFWPSAIKIHAAAQRRLHDDAKDFTALIDGFHAHEAFKTLAASTRRGYQASAQLVKAAWAFDLPAELTTVDAQQAIDSLGDTPASANQFRAYLSRLMAWGVPRGFSAANPVQFTEKIPGGEPWSPWPEWAWQILVEHAPFNLLLPAISALFTGQRQGDVLLMKRPRDSENTIEVRAQKTKSTVWVPVHSAYRQWIDKAPRGDVVQLHVGVKGLPYETTDGFRADWQRLMNTEPFKPFRENRLVFHGIRKNAVINLLEVGCTETQVGAICNMSEEMVRHYGREVSVRALARDGMKLLESRYAEVRQPALEQEQNANWKPSVRIGNRWTRDTLAEQRKKK